jgi:hypothetical protein
MVKTKPEERSSGMREPGPKKKLGLTVPPALRLPHDDLIHAIVPEAEAETSMPSQTSQGSQTSQPRPARQTRQGAPNIPPVAPERDYTKTANSIVRDAVSGGVFKGKSKQLYDCLYTMTRGAIIPTRTVRISRPKLMSRAHVGSRVTFDTNIRHLSQVGLIRVRPIPGEHEGNEYEVFLPEETSMPSQTSQGSQTSLTGSALKVDRLDSLESRQTRHSSTPLETGTYNESKTFSKDYERIDDDDAALAGLNSALKQAAEEVTGRELSAAERDRWRELGEVLATELKIAAARTTVSSVPSFLAEHLRRRLWKKDNRELQAEALTATPAGSTSDSFTAEQIKKCPECGGTGFRYKGENFTGGVEKCRHEKLTASPDPSNEKSQT